MRTFFLGSKQLIFIVFIFFFVPASMHSQDTIKNRFYVKIAPLPLLDIYSGMSPRAGIEWQFKQCFGMYAEFGTYIPNVNGMSDNTGFLSKLEIKKYFEQHDEDFYISAEVFYKRQAYGTYDSISLNNTSYQKNYSVAKKVYCLTLKTGILLTTELGITLEPFAGLGIRYREINNSLTYDENRFIMQDGSSRTNIIKNQAGAFRVLNLDLGVKIGYRIR